jgi:geranylgeranyl transferase type-2 subunit alpha
MLKASDTLQEQLSYHTEMFNFTTSKINQNFSNYSAWHARSVTLPFILQSLGSQEEKAQRMREEFELAQSAFYTEPTDQSAWLYQRWLIGYGMGSVTLQYTT